MTIEEKLQHFTSVTIENVQSKCDESLETYKTELDGQFERYREEAERLSVLEEKTLRDGIERQASKEFTIEQLQLRRKVSLKKDELKDRLFLEVESQLKEYRKRPEYKQYMVRQIGRAKEFAEGEEVHIFIDPEDEYMKEELEKQCSVTLHVAGNSFKGGIRAELPKRNILIDNTFETKLEEEKEKFSIGRKES